MRTHLFSIILVLLAGCTVPFTQFDPDIINPTIELVLPDPCTDCDSLTEITEPKFITGWMHVDGNPTVPLTYHAGPYSITIDVDDANPQDSIHKLMEAYAPHGYMVRHKEHGWLVVFAIGTNDHKEHLLQIWVEANGAKYYFPWNSQAMYVGGGLSPEEYVEAVEIFPSIRSFNYQGTSWTPEDYEKADRKILGCCKAGRYRADFRFGTHQDSTIQDFVDVGWDLVISNVNGPIQERTVSHSIDLRGSCPSDTEIINHLLNNRIVITDL